MNYLIDLQIACDDQLPIADTVIETWATLPLESEMEKAELTIRLVSVEEMTALNSTYRHQNKVTNVLAFPAAIPPGVELDYPLLGDVVICPAVLFTESVEQEKTLDFHWAHIIIHGVLHLLGYDHIEDKDAKIMQAREIEFLTHLGYPNPYINEDCHIE